MAEKKPEVKVEEKTLEVKNAPEVETKKEEATTKEIKSEKKDDTPKGVRRERGFNIDEWKPLTKRGKEVKSGKITDIDEFVGKGQHIMEASIVDALVQNLQSDLLAIGQSKGKFGGGKRSIWRQTQKKTSEGNKPSFTALAVVGNTDGYVGIGTGKSKETVPAREKATRRAKLNLIKVIRGCGSWECGCGTPHSIPFKVTGNCGSIRMTLMPAPRGKSIVAERECQRILRFAGIKDVYAKTEGHTATKINLIKACFDALQKLSQVKVPEAYYKKAGIQEKA